MADRTFRIVQVGAAPSGIGAAWLSLLQEAPDWQLAGVVEVVPEARSLALERAGLGAEHGFGSIADAATALAFDAVAIIAPSPLHTDLALQALQADKHVIVEKPFAVDFEAARAVVALAERRGLRVIVDQNYRYLPDLLALRRAVRDQVAGRPAVVAVGFNCDWAARTYQAAMANTMLLEMAVHHFDSIRFVLGSEPLTALGQTWRPPWTRYAGDTWVHCAFEFPDQVRALYTGNLEAPGAGDPWQGVWRVECERGALQLADLGSGYGLYLSRAPQTIELLESFGTSPSPGSAIPGALREFAKALREGRRPEGDGRDNLHTLAMAFGVARSSAERRAIDLQGSSSRNRIRWSDECHAAVFSAGWGCAVRRDTAWAYFFIAPQLIGMLAFAVVPMIAVLALSFGSWDLIHAIKWVGTGNYRDEFSDPIFWKSVKNTLYYTGVFIPASLIVALLVALVLNRKMAFRSWYRAIFFLPVITPTVAVALVWTWLLNPDYGLVNDLLYDLGINGPGWYADIGWAMPSAILVSVWRNFGYSMVIFLAGLQGVPAQLYEAAQIDGGKPLGPASGM